MVSSGGGPILPSNGGSNLLFGYAVGIGDPFGVVACFNHTPNRASRHPRAFDAWGTELDSRIQQDAVGWLPGGRESVAEGESVYGDEVFAQEFHGELTVLACGDEAFVEFDEDARPLCPNDLGGEWSYCAGLLTEPVFGGVDGAEVDVCGAECSDDAERDEIFEGDDDLLRRHSHKGRTGDPATDPTYELLGVHAVDFVGETGSVDVSSRLGDFIDARELRVRRGAGCEEGELVRHVAAMTCVARMWSSYLVVLHEDGPCKASSAHDSGNCEREDVHRNYSLLVTAGGSGKLPLLRNPMPRIALQMTQGK